MDAGPATPALGLVAIRPNPHFGTLTASSAEIAAHAATAADAGYAAHAAAAAGPPGVLARTFDIRLTLVEAAVAVGAVKVRFERFRIGILLLGRSAAAAAAGTIIIIRSSSSSRMIRLDRGHLAIRKHGGELILAHLRLKYTTV